MGQLQVRFPQGTLLSSSVLTRISLFAAKLIEQKHPALFEHNALPVALGEAQVGSFLLQGAHFLQDTATGA